VPHGREEQRCSDFVRRDVGRFFLDLRHPNQVTIVFETVERRGLVIKLVTEDDCQMPDPGHALMTRGRSARS